MSRLGWTASNENVKSIYFKISRCPDPPCTGQGVVAIIHLHFPLYCPISHRPKIFSPRSLGLDEGTLLRRLSAARISSSMCLPSEFISKPASIFSARYTAAFCQIIAFVLAIPTPGREPFYAFTILGISLHFLSLSPTVPRRRTHCSASTFLLSVS